MDIWKIAGIIIFAALISVWLGAYKTEWKVYITLAAGVLAASYMVDYLCKLIFLLKEKEIWFVDAQGYLEIIIKALGITYISQFASDICKDTGNHLLQSQIELCGKAAVLLLGIPILLAVVDTILYG